MNDSRSITKYLKKAKETSFVNLEFLDKMNPNTFELTKNGRIQTSVYGAFSSILIKLDVLETKTNTYNKIEYALHPDRMGLICDKVLKGNLRTLSRKQNPENPEYRGEVYKSIFTGKAVGTKFECSLLNIFFNEETDEFVIGLKTGVGKLVKDDTNRNDFEDFEKNNYIGICIPYEQMELMCYQTKEFLNSYKLTMTPAMLKGRHAYEMKCKTIYKGCKGDVKKIREIEEKFNNLSESEKRDCLANKRTIE